MKKMIKRAARVLALLARAAETRQKFLLALGHPTLRLRGREVMALRSTINGADKILSIRAIRVREGSAEACCPRSPSSAIKTRRLAFRGDYCERGRSPTSDEGKLRRVSVLDRRC